MQKPLTLVVIGGMSVAPLLILLILIVTLSQRRLEPLAAREDTVEAYQPVQAPT